MNSHVILVGDLIPNALEPIRLSLQQFGYNLLVTQNAAEALAIAKASPVVGVLVDISAPEINGVETCSFLRHTLKIPVIALNHGEPTLQKAALMAGANVVLDYPINWQTLQKVLSVAQPETRSAVDGLFGNHHNDIVGGTALLSHDLKSPISVIISSLEVLITSYENDPAMESTMRLLRGALNAAYRQLYMISDLLDLARLEISEYDLRLEDVDLVQIVCDGLDTEAYALSTKKLQLSVELPEEPLMAKVDVSLMGRVISALVDNVIKFTVRDDQLKVSAWREGDKIVIMFTDNGRPIRPGFEQEILLRASQWEGRQSGTRTSVGMGLPFVYAVAKALGGEFAAKTDPDTGLTSFSLTLPTSQ